jgi:hypothetical protein
MGGEGLSLFSHGVYEHLSHGGITLSHHKRCEPGVIPPKRFISTSTR